MKFILQCIQDELSEFREPELNSVAKLFNFKIIYDSPLDVNTRPYVVVNIPGEKEALLLASRAMSIKFIWRYWCEGANLEELHEENKKVSNLWPYAIEETWRLSPISYGKTLSSTTKSTLMKTFHYMTMLSNAQLVNPTVEIGILHEYTNPTAYQCVQFVEVDRSEPILLRRIFMGSKLCEGPRGLIEKFDLKKRAYIGTTSMAAEVSFVMANNVLAGPGKLIYDPFAGTGSLLISCSAFGALTFGGDIDPKQFRGKETNVASNAEQYNLSHRILDCVIFDMLQHPFRTGSIFDAIITDPPYGVRAGARKSGRSELKKPYVHKVVPGTDGLYCHQMPDFHPPTTPWEMTSVINNLLSLSLYLLKPNGRIAFFLPSDNADFKDVDIPICEGLELISVSSQSFGKWSRRLVTMEKVGEGVRFGKMGERGIVGDREEGEIVRGVEKIELGDVEGGEVEREKGGMPGTANFRDKYYAKFVGSGSI